MVKFLPRWHTHSAWTKIIQMVEGKAKPFMVVDVDLVKETKLLGVIVNDWLSWDSKTPLEVGLTLMVFITGPTTLAI